MVRLFLWWKGEEEQLNSTFTYLFKEHLLSIAFVSFPWWLCNCNCFVVVFVFNPTWKKNKKKTSLIKTVNWLPPEPPFYPPLHFTWSFSCNHSVSLHLLLISSVKLQPTWPATLHQCGRRCVTFQAVRRKLVSLWLWWRKQQLVVLVLSVFYAWSILSFTCLTSTDMSCPNTLTCKFTTNHSHGRRANATYLTWIAKRKPEQWWNK